MVQLLWTLFFGLLGGWVGYRLRLPAGALIGAIASVALFNLVTESAYFPLEVKILSQALSGAYIGAGVTRSDVLELKTIVRPALILVVGMCLFNIAVSLFLARFTPIDLVTCLFATAPGGITDMSLIATDMGGNPATVASVQLLRIVTVIGVTPHMLRFCLNYFSKPEDRVAGGSQAPQGRSVGMKSRANLFLTLTVALATGAVGYVSGFPAGTMVFSMASIAGLNIAAGRAYMPIRLRLLAQALSGTLIGMRFTMRDVWLLLESFWPLVVVLAGFLVMNVVLGVLIYKTSRLTLSTSLFASAAGGMSDLALIAAEMGGDAPKVVALQLVRLVSVIAFYPTIISLITG